LGQETDSSGKKEEKRSLIWQKGWLEDDGGVAGVMPPAVKSRSLRKGESMGGRDKSDARRLNRLKKRIRGGQTQGSSNTSAQGQKKVV